MYTVYYIAVTHDYLITSRLTFLAACAYSPYLLKVFGTSEAKMRGSINKFILPESTGG